MILYGIDNIRDLFGHKVGYVRLRDIKIEHCYLRTICEC